jgi:two-component system phosphate regulon sensor histidine kinase PhoR
MERLDLGGLLRTEVENLRAMAAERSVTIKEPPAGEFMVRGNADKLIQLIDNLLINAVKYNKEHGQVIASLGLDDNKVVLTVSDSGVGIEREQMAKIFNRFYRAKMTGTGRIEGLGIGLSLVQEIVLLHGGDIKVASVPGEGTTFTVELEATR